MSALAEMMARFAQPGRVEALLVRPDRRAPMVSVNVVRLLEHGLAGDHSRAGKRAVTVLQAEHVPVIAALAGRGDVTPEMLRRNIVVSGLNLLAFREKRVRIGAAVVELTIPCHPCSRMEEALGQGGYTAMRGHGGFCASVVVAGEIRLGDAVAPVALDESVSTLI